MFVHFRTDQNLILSRRSTVSRSQVDGITDYGELHTILGANEPMYNFAAMDSDAESRVRSTTHAARLVEIGDGELHLNRRLQGVFMVLWIRFRATEDGQDSVPKKFVNRSVIRENHRNQNLQVIVQHLQRVVWLHLVRHLRKTPNVGVQDRHFAASA